MPRHTYIEIDPAAMAANVRAVKALIRPAAVCAVVKADGYGHGSVIAARAALAGGATWLAVALPEEGQVLRDAGIDAPILLLSEPSPDVMPDVFAARLVPTLYSPTGIEAACRCVRSLDGPVPWQVHLKVDTGMHRVGVDLEDAVDTARTITMSPELELGGTFTHFAVADEPERGETELQLSRFGSLLHDLDVAGIGAGVRHVSNSAGALRLPEARYDMVRIGISLYGYSPFGFDSPEAGWLEPAMTLRSEVAFVRHLAAGEGISYGLRHRLEHDGRVAVVPLGYADGIDRRLGMAGGQVLIGGHRHRICGIVTMDQLMVELADGVEVHPGDEVILIGTQGDETVTAYEWADLLGTIPYEVLCRFSVRVPRVIRVDSGDPAVGDPAVDGPAPGESLTDDLYRLAP